MDKNQPAMESRSEEVPAGSIMLNERPDLRAASLAVLISILWGGNTISIKIGLALLPPLALAGARFVLGGLAVLAWTLAVRVPLRLSRNEAPGLVLLSLLFLVQISLLNLGTAFTLAGRVAVLLNSYPLFTAVFAHFLLPGDRLSRPKVVGLLLAFSGVFVLFAGSFAGGSTRYLAGDLMGLASGVLLGLRQVYTKRLTQAVHPGKLVFWQSALSVPLFLLLSLLIERPALGAFTPLVTGAVLYQGLVVAGGCFIVQVTLLRRFTASRITVFAFLTPVAGVFLSGLILGEPITAALLASLALVAAGITVVNLSGAAAGTG